MSDDTEFIGEFLFSAPLTPEHYAYLKAFNRSRRMKRHAAETEKLADPLRLAVGLPVGDEGEFFVAEANNNMGQVHTPDIANYNSPPATQPSLWCQWIPNEQGTALVWDECEKFAKYIEWLKYMIEKFFRPWGYTLNGRMRLQGSEPDDRSVIRIVDNDVMSWDD